MQLQVLDLGQVVAGNFAGALLAYYGADVIKVESPGRGDALRHLRATDRTNTSLWWRSYVRGKSGGGGVDGTECSVLVALILQRR